MLVTSTIGACAPTPIYYWGEYETGLLDRYVNEQPTKADAYLNETISTVEQQHLKVPPGAYADYGFVLYKRGDRNGAVAYFEKEKQIFPESSALMTKLIERVTQKKTTSTDNHTMPVVPEPGIKP